MLQAKMIEAEEKWKNWWNQCLSEIIKNQRHQYSTSLESAVEIFSLSEFPRTHSEQEFEVWQYRDTWFKKGVNKDKSVVPLFVGVVFAVFKATKMFFNYNSSFLSWFGQILTHDVHINVNYFDSLAV